MHELCHLLQQVLAFDARGRFFRFQGLFITVHCYDIQLYCISRQSMFISLMLTLADPTCFNISLDLGINTTEGLSKIK